MHVKYRFFVKLQWTFWTIWMWKIHYEFFMKYFFPPSNLMAYNKLAQKCQHGSWNRKQYPPHFLLFVLKLLSYFKLTQLINLFLFLPMIFGRSIRWLEIKGQKKYEMWNLFYFPHTLCNLTRIAIANKELFIGLHLTRQCRPAALLRINRHAKNI